MSATVNTYDSAMARWEPDARRRLEQAAFALYSEQGFDRTTVAEIAERAGLTERTFFRHFADKREVLFSGADTLQDALVTAVERIPDSLAPIDAAAAGVQAIAALLPERATAQKRQAIVAANAELQERELTKMASLSAALAGALRRRGVGEPSASLTAEIAIAVFRVAFDCWVDQTNQLDLPELIHESLEEVKTLSSSSRTGGSVQSCESRQPVHPLRG
jgi:AcrR family transcriptional regulator